MATLGEMLFEARKRKGVSLTEVSKATRIRMSMLEAMENDDHDMLPDPGYTRGFISSYARYLTTDARPFLDQYARDIGVPKRQPVELVQSDEVVAHRSTLHDIPLKAIVVIAGIIALLALLIWGIISAVTKGQPTVAPVPVSVTSESGATTQSKTMQTLLPFTLEVAVKNEGASSVVITIDGAEAYNGSMTAGDTQTFEVSKTAVLVIDNPSKVTVKQNGTNIPVTKKTMTLTYTKSSK